MSAARRPSMDTGALARLRAPWLDLWMRCGGDPFQHPDWIMAWWDVFAPGPPAVALVREGDRLAALAPLYRDPASGLVLPMGVGPSDRTDVLVDPAMPDAAERLSAAIGTAAAGDDILWPDVPADGHLHRVSPGPGRVRDTAAGSPCPVIDLGPGLAAVPSARWRKWRMAGHRAARRGTVAVVHAGALGAGEFAERLIALNTVRFDPASGGVFADPRMAAFVRRVVPALDRAGVLDGLAVSIGTELAGIQCGFRAAGRTYAWLGGFAPDFTFESPGTLLMGEAIRRAVARGDRAFDLLRGNEAYKAGWGAVDRPLVRVRWSRADGV